MDAAAGALLLQLGNGVAVIGFVAWCGVWAERRSEPNRF
jgi:hypothetical protein